MDKHLDTLANLFVINSSVHLFKRNSHLPNDHRDLLSN